MREKTYLKRRWCLCSWAIALASLSGCSHGDGRVAVTGEVTLDGKPLEDATIRFEPVDLNAATGSGGTVHEGKYSIPAEHGLSPGKYKVLLAASEKTGKMIPHPMGAGQIEEYREIRFKEAGQLEITLDSSTSTHFDFALTREAARR